MNGIDYQRLLSLSNKVKSNQASKPEKDEYMNLLYHNDSITQKQYNDYKQGRNVEEIINAALVIGGIVLLGYLLTKITE
jgi:hypothetical protein